MDFMQADARPQPVENHREAEVIAHTRLRVLSAKGDLVIDPSKTLEKPWGWVFFYAPRAFLETGDVGLLTPGDGPLVVLRSGGVRHLSTSLPPAVAISRLDRELNR